MNGCPIVNLNGTSRDALIEARITAVEAIRAAMAALSECAPNGRDYQTAPKGEYEIARAQYTTRFAFLDKLANELMDEACEIQDA